MKKIIIGVFALSLAFSATAQKGKKQDSKEHKIERKEQFGQRLKAPQLAKRLELTQEQRTRIQTLNQSFKEKLQELNKQDNITVKEQRERQAALAKEHRESIQAVLTAEQLKQLEETKKDAVKNKERRVEHLDKRLDLTHVQSQQIKEVNQQFKEKVQEVQKNESLTREQKRDQVKTLQQTHTEQIRSILTEEQKNKLEALKRHKVDRRTGK